jgi:hypothetical protein
MNGSTGTNAGKKCARGQLHDKAAGNYTIRQRIRVLDKWPK